MNSIEQLMTLWRTNPNFVVGVWGTSLVAAYYAVVWMLVGRDPAPGTIVVRYEAPHGLSPGALRYLRKFGLDEKAFAAALIDMAGKGCLRIEQTETGYSLWRGPADLSNLPPDEAAIGRVLFNSRNQVKLDGDSQLRIYAAALAMKSKLDHELEKAYLRTNRKYLFPGVIISGAVICYLVFTEYIKSLLHALVLCWLLSAFGLILIALSLFLNRAWTTAFRAESARRQSMQNSIKVTLFVLPFFLAEVVLIYAFQFFAPSWLLIFVFVPVILTLVAHLLLKAPSKAGRELLDQIDGFRRFLSAAEQDRLNFLNPPDKTAELFERNLAYAYALDVEQQWSEQFAEAGVENAVGGWREALGASQDWITLDLSTFGVFIQRLFPFKTYPFTISVGPQ